MYITSHKDLINYKVLYTTKLWHLKTYMEFLKYSNFKLWVWWVMCIKCSYIVLVLNITNAKTTFSVASLKDVPHLCMYSTCKTKFNHEIQNIPKIIPYLYSKNSNTHTHVILKFPKLIYTFYHISPISKYCF